MTNSALLRDKNICSFNIQWSYPRPSPEWHPLLYLSWCINDFVMHSMKSFSKRHNIILTRSLKRTHWNTLTIIKKRQLCHPLIFGGKNTYTREKSAFILVHWKLVWKKYLKKVYEITWCSNETILKMNSTHINPGLDAQWLTEHRFIMTASEVKEARKCNNRQLLINIDRNTSLSK